MADLLHTPLFAQLEVDAIFETGPGPTLNLEDFKKLLLSPKAE